MIMIRFILPCLTLILTNQLARSANTVSWPGWLGPERSGWVDHAIPPDQWPEKLSEIWEVEVGEGYATTLVRGDRLYHHARQGDDEVVWCLDLRTGQTLWRKHYPVAFTPGGGGTFHGKGPKSSPVLSGDRLITLSITGILSAWDTQSGDLLWREDFRDRFSKNQPYWGVSTSPLAEGDLVIVQAGNDEAGALIALHAADGKERWRHGNEPTSYSSPIAVEIDGVRQIIQFADPGLAGIDSKTGKKLWSYAFPQRRNVQNTATPNFYKGRLIIGGEDRGMRCVEPKKVGETWQAKEIWSQDEVSLDMSTTVVNEDAVYGFSHRKRGQFFCLNPDTGKVWWKGDGRAGKNVAFLAVPQHVLAMVDDGELQVLKASKEGYEKLRSYEMADSPTWSPPVLLKDKLLIKDVKTLTLWSLK